MLNLDTHILLFALAGSLTSGERRLLSGTLWCIGFHWLPAIGE